MKISLSILYLSLLFCATAFPQSGKLFSVDKELSSSLINHVYQDHRDIMWIATADGLNRYDGSKFTVYKKVPQDTNSLLSNYVNVIFEDSKRRLFVGLFSGLQYYDYATETFHSVPLILDDGNSFPAFVTSIIERRNGDLLVATSGHGVFSVKRRHGKMIATQEIKLSPSFMINLLYEDKQENVWVATQDEGLFRLGPGTGIHHYFSSLSRRTISSVCEDNNGNLYVGDQSTGLYVYNDHEDSFNPVRAQGQMPLRINKLYRSRSGDVFIGTEGEGLYIFHPENNTITEGLVNTNVLDLSKSKVHSIVEDRKGNIWLGIHQKGVVLLPVRSNDFKYYGYKSVRNNIIGSSAITAIHKDRNGTIWIGTDGDGVYGIKSGGKKTHHYSNFTNRDVPSSILSLHEDRFNNLWLGSYDQGLARINLKTGQCENVNHLIVRDGGQIPRIFSMAEDEENNLWIATMGSGLYCLHLPSGRVHHYRAPQGTDYREDANTLNSDWIYSIHVTDNNKLYIGSVDGMGCLDIKSRSFNSTFGVNRLMPGVIVNVVFQDKEGTVWAGTGEGLIALKGEQRKMTKFTVDDGLPSNVICAIQQDTSDDLWISTNYGIARLDLSTREFLNFYADDGLQGNEFSRGASYLDKDGVIMFGGINGVTLFSPNDIKRYDKTPELFVAGFYIHNQPVTKGMKSGRFPIVNRSVMDSDTFQISEDDNSFTIEFSSMEFENPDRITYMYNLQNDNNWIILPPGTNRVTFNNLDPGSYRLALRAKDYNSYSDPKVISVIVHPFWYFSTVAKLVYVVIGLTILGVFIHHARQRQRTKRKMLEHIHAKQVNEAKLQFFINIAHEIRTPMSLIINPLRKLLLKDKDREHQRAYYTMNQNAERIIRLINQLMDVQKIDQGRMALRFQRIELVSFIRGLCLAFKEEAQSKEIDLRFNYSVKGLEAYVDPDNFDKVIINIVSNALKFTPPHGVISIDLTSGAYDGLMQQSAPGFFQLTITDTGIGIPEGELEKVFECFYQSRDSRHMFRQGTGIGLHLTRSIVELHHGTIWAEKNAASPGAMFVIRVPLGHEHLKPEEIFTAETPEPERLERIRLNKDFRAPLPEAKPKARNRQRVLVVDDDQVMCEYLCTEMGNDYHMSKCADGKEALSFILEHTPDLVISDVVMPEMDGITLCRRVKQNVNINHIPVVLLTARKEEQHNLEGLGIGADAYIVKPFNIEIVRKTVQSIIKNREMLRNSYNGNHLQNDKVRDIEVKSPDEKLLGKIMDTINANISNPGLSVEMLAHEIGISRVHLHRKMKELTNQSTRDLVRNIRLQKAAKLLAEKHLNISEVAFAVGFTNVAHFSTAFKEFFGMSPTAYMETQRDH